MVFVFIFVLLVWTKLCCVLTNLLVATCEKGADGGRCKKRQDTKRCVREGAWPVHPLGNAAADPNDLEQLALMLELSGVQIEELRELGLWMHLTAP